MRSCGQGLLAASAAVSILGTCIAADVARNHGLDSSAQMQPLQGAARAGREDTRFFAAVALGLFGHPPDPSAAEADMREIADLGSTGVVLPVFWRSDDYRSTRIGPFAYGVPQSAYDDSEVEIARRAHALGLSFEVLPILQIDRLGPGEWRGTLAPSDWASWWRSYRSFVLHHAEVAERAGAEILSVGSELGTTESDRARWSELIAAVRRFYRGRLIYSANWDHYRSVGFWDLLDGVGLSAYYELADDPSASQSAIDAAWRSHRETILAWARPLGKPLYLTEVGYPAQPGAAVHPWDYTLSEPADVVAQARCYRAFTEAWRGVPELSGVTIWLWDHGKGGPSDPSYAIRGKPAAKLVAEFFRARTGPPSPR